MDYQVVSKNRRDFVSIVDCPTAEWALAIAEIDSRRGQFQHIVDRDGGQLDLAAFKAQRRGGARLGRSPDRQGQ